MVTFLIVLGVLKLFGTGWGWAIFFALLAALLVE